MSATMSKAKAVSMGYSADKRKRRRQHRKNARFLGTNGGGSIFGSVVRWHRTQARWGR